MNKLIAPLAAVGLLAITAGSASAASPAYCALYAREYALEYVRTASKAIGADSQQRIQDKAFYKCLNLDEQPSLPETSAYSDTGNDLTADPAADVPSDPRESAPARNFTKAAKVAVASGGRHRGSGFEPWTPRWKAWCAEHFPRSFDPKTGFVIPLAGKKTLCR